MPIGLRKWFVERLVKQLESEKEAIENASNSKGRGNQTHMLTESTLPPPSKSYSKQYEQE